MTRPPDSGDWDDLDDAIVHAFAALDAAVERTYDEADSTALRNRVLNELAGITDEDVAPAPAEHVVTIAAPAMRGMRGRVLTAVLLAAAVVVAGVIGVSWLTGTRSPRPVITANPGHSTQVGTTDPTPPTPSGATGTQSYTGPGGIHVVGPAGWVRDSEAGIPSVVDYREPSSGARLAGATFRIGIGNSQPSKSFDDEINQTADFLTAQYGASAPLVQRGTFLGTASADIEFMYFNADVGVQRRAVERIWRDGSVTLIIECSGLATSWAETRAVFDQLVSSASVS